MKENAESEVEVMFTEGPSSDKKTTSLRRTSRKTSSAVSFTPMKMKKSTPGITLTLRKTSKSPASVTITEEGQKPVSPKSKITKGRRIKRKRKFTRTKRGRPRKSDDEAANYGELTIEVAEKKEDTEDSEDDEVEFVEAIFTEPARPDDKEKKKRKKKKSYDWSENEVFSLIGKHHVYNDFYSFETFCCHQKKKSMFCYI